MDLEFSIWMATRTRWAHLTKVISLPAVPRVGEFVKFRNEKLGDYFSFRVSQVTYRENGLIEVWTELFENIDNRMYSFEDEPELDEYFQAYIAEGWRCHRGIGPNNRYRAVHGVSNDGTQPDRVAADDHPSPLRSGG